MSEIFYSYNFNDTFIFYLNEICQKYKLNHRKLNLLNFFHLIEKQISLIIRRLLIISKYVKFTFVKFRIYTSILGAENSKIN